MKFLITAGCTGEPIDGIRSITSIPSIELGTYLVQEVLKNNDEVYLVTSELITDESILNNSNFEQFKVDTVASVLNCLQKLIFNKKIDVVISCMAISDFVVEGNLPMDKFNLLNNDGSNFNELLERNTNKLDSSKDVLLYLKRAPKVINKIKEWDPNIYLVGFKLLVNATNERKLQAINKQFNSANSDLIVYNDWKDISSNSHVAQILDKNNVIKECFSKKEIAKSLIEIIKERI